MSDGADRIPREVDIDGRARDFLQPPHDDPPDNPVPIEPPDDGGGGGETIDE